MRTLINIIEPKSPRQVATAYKELAISLVKWFWDVHIQNNPLENEDFIGPVVRIVQDDPSLCEVMICDIRPCDTHFDGLLIMEEYPIQCEALPALETRFIALNRGVVSSEGNEQRPGVILSMAFDAEHLEPICEYLKTIYGPDATETIH